MLSEAQSEIQSWWADRKPRIGSGHRIQSGLDNQVRRDAMEKAHVVASLRNLSVEDTRALVLFAIQHCEAPRVKP